MKGIMGMQMKSKAVFFVMFLLFLPLIGWSQNAVTSTSVAVAGVPDVPGNLEIWTGVLYYSLLVVLGGVFLALIGKVLRIYELSGQISGRDKSINWNLVNGIGMMVFLLVGMGGVIWELDVHGAQTLPESGSVHGLVTDNLQHTTLLITGVVFFITQFLLFGYGFIYRYRQGRKAFFYPDNNKLEQAWTVAPAIVLTVLVIFGFFAWREITGGAELKGKIIQVVELTGEQFKWNVRYPGPDGVLGKKDYKLISDINFLGIDFKDNHADDDIIAKPQDTIYLLKNRPVKLVLGAKDVIHSAYMPFFRVQMNCVPGLPTYFYFTPRLTTDEMRAKLNDDNFSYMLVCAKICGASHFNMGRVVKVVDERAYNVWKSKQKAWYDNDKRQQLKLTNTNGKASERSLASIY